jgi:uncharacterized membrane protein YuzA (DUF378 family)
MTFIVSHIVLAVKQLFFIVKSVANEINYIRRKLIMKKLDILAAVLVVIGALNWGMVAIAHFDLVATLFGMKFGEVSTLSAIVYGLVGLAGLYQGVSFKAIQQRWHTSPSLQHSR